MIVETRMSPSGTDLYSLAIAFCAAVSQQHHHEQVAHVDPTGFAFEHEAEDRKDPQVDERAAEDELEKWRRSARTLNANRG